MQAQLEIPIILRRVGIHGPTGVREIDVILDTGLFTLSSLGMWPRLRPEGSARRDIAYGPAIFERRMPIITANGVLEAPLITVEHIQVAELLAKAVDVVCDDIPEIAGIEGLLSLSFLRHFPWPGQADPDRFHHKGSGDQRGR